MWRIFFSLTVLQYIFPFNSNAQLLVGPVAGLGVSKVFFFDQASADAYKTLPSVGIDGGLMGSLVVRKNFVLNAQLLYSYRTKHISGRNQPNSDAQFKFSSTMQYIELPIFYVLEFKSLTGNPTGRGGRVKTYNWFIGGGPTISYWLSGKSTLHSSNLLENGIDHVNYTSVFGADNSGIPPSITSTKEYISEANRFQFAINITGGVAFEPVGFHKIVTFAQFNIAQTFLAKSDVSLPSYDVDVLRAKNHSFKISVAYLFDTKMETSKKGKSTKNKEVQKKRR
jgi:hypothetical protein